VKRNAGSNEFVLSDGFTNVNTPKAVIAFFISEDKSKWSAEFPLLSNI